MTDRFPWPPCNLPGPRLPYGQNDETGEKARSGQVHWDDLCEHCYIKPKRRGGVECEACSKYRRRNGRGRPLYLIERDLEKTSHPTGRTG